MKMQPDDAYALRMALEPLTHAATEYDPPQLFAAGELALASIAISLKRIADAIEGNPTKAGIADAVQFAITEGILTAKRMG